MSIPGLMRRGSLLASAAALVALGLTASPAWAQETAQVPDFSLDRLELNAGLGPLLAGSGELLSPGTMRFSLVGHYQRNPFLIASGTEKLPLVRERVTGVLAVAWGVLPWLELDAALPVVAWQEGSNLSELGIASPDWTGVGSPRLHGRVGLLNLSSAGWVDLALEVGVGLPVGRNGALAREAGTSLTGRVLVGGRLGPLASALDVGGLLRPTVSLGTATGSQDDVGNELRVGGTLSTTGTPLRGELGIRAAFSHGRTWGTGELLGGARYALGETVEVFALLGLGFGGEPGTPLYRGLLGVALTHVPRPKTEPDIFEIITLPPRASPAAEEPEDTSEPEEEGAEPE